jgi:hypothetical protein
MQILFGGKLGQAKIPGNFQQALGNIGGTLGLIGDVGGAFGGIGGLGDLYNPISQGTGY